MSVSNRLKAMAILAVAAMAWTGGCAPSCPQTHVSREELVHDYNQNASAVPRLKARARISLTIADAKGRRFSWGSTLASPNGLLILAKGDQAVGEVDFALIGRMTGATELFRMGVSNTDGAYYLWYNAGNQHGAWWGRRELAGAPDVEIPLDPTQLLSVLCVTELPADFTTVPTVAMTLSDNPCAYVLTFIDRQPLTGQIVFRREMFFRRNDKLPRRPFLVNIFDNDGRRAMSATLRAYKPIALAGLPPSSPAIAPVMPTDIDISWKGNNRLHLVLSEMTTAEDWDRQQLLFTPNLPRAIPLENVLQVDKNVAGGATE